MRSILFALVALPVSGCAFQAGTLLAQSGGDISAGAALGCLEVSIGEARDPQVRFDFGNRCRWPVGVDFRAVVVTAYTVEGAPVLLAPSDPRDELELAVL